MRGLCSMIRYFLPSKNYRSVVLMIAHLWQAGSIQNGEPDRLEGFAYTINQSMANLAASSKSVLFGDFSKYIIRMAGGPVYLRLDERFADSLQVGFLAYQRVDGELLSSNAIKVITQAAS
jgi:HK97 family phage major capsid protein